MFFPITQKLTGLSFPKKSHGRTGPYLMSCENLKPLSPLVLEKLIHNYLTFQYVKDRLIRRLFFFLGLQSEVGTKSLRTRHRRVRRLCGSVVGGVTNLSRPMGLVGVHRLFSRPICLSDLTGGTSSPRSSASIETSSATASLNFSNGKKFDRSK